MSFQALPQEIRLAIFELVAQEQKKIVPKQTAERANTFFPGYGQDPFIVSATTRGQRVPEPPLKISPLMLVCKQWNGDLEKYPIFYRVNKFAFGHPIHLHNFLAALTPERRRMIRDIEVFNSPEPKSNKVEPNKWHSTSLGTRLNATQLKHMFTLLTDCRDLRRITWNVELHRLPDVLDEIVLQSQSNALSRERSLWRLPGFNIRIIIPLIENHHLRRTTDAFADLENTISFHDYDPHKHLDRLHRPFAPMQVQPGPLLQKARDFLKSLQEKQSLQRREDHIPYPTDQQVYNACRAASVDFPGDTRVLRKRAVGVADTISRRTRGQLQAELNVTEMGVISRAVSKYDGHGLLILPVEVVENVRWKDNGQEIECLVRLPYNNNRYTDQRHIWEDIQHFASFPLLTKIRHYYSHMYQHGVGHPVERLKLIEESPEPKHIMDVVSGLMDPDEKKPKSWDLHWNTLSQLRESQIKELTKRAAIKEAKRQAQKDKKTASRLAREQKEKDKADRRAARAASRSNDNAANPVLHLAKPALDAANQDAYDDDEALYDDDDGFYDDGFYGDDGTYDDDGFYGFYNDDGGQNQLYSGAANGQYQPYNGAGYGQNQLYNGAASNQHQPHNGTASGQNQPYNTANGQNQLHNGTASGQNQPYDEDDDLYEPYDEADDLFEPYDEADGQYEFDDEADQY